MADDQETTETQSGSGGQDDSQSGTDTGTSESKADGAQSGADSGKEKTETVSKAEHDRVMNRMQAADRRASQMEAELKALRDKDLPEAEKLKKDFEETAAERDKLRGDLQQARIDNAFLKDNTYTWHDPEAVMAILKPQMDRVSIDSDGNVTGLRDLLKDLAKAKPWMLKEKEAGTGGSTPPMNGGKGGSSAPDKKTQQRRFPAMGTRGTR